MPTLTIRRLDEADHAWLRQAAKRQGISVEEYVRRMARTARTDASRSLGELLESMNASLDADDRALLAEPLAIERPPVRARELSLPDDDDASTRHAS